MRSSLLVVAVALLYPLNVWAQGKATNTPLKCGPASWARPMCPACKDGEKTYVTVKFVEAAIAEAHEPLKKDLADSKKEADAMAAVIGATHTNQKQWTEQGSKNGEIKVTYCWDPVKAEEIKPLKDKSYSLGTYYDGRCKAETVNTCYHFTMECRKPRGKDIWGCIPHLQAFPPKDGACDDSPTKSTCDCQPSAYWKCGLKGKAAGKKKGKRR